MIDIRLATESDLPGLRAMIHAQAIDPVKWGPLDEDEVDHVVADMAPLVATQSLIVALDGPVVVGNVTMRRSWRRGLRHAALLGISIRAAYRDRGLGRRLMTEAIAWAKERGVTRIELHVLVWNARAIALYEKLGFVHEGRLRGALWVGGELCDDFVMALILE